MTYSEPDDGGHHETKSDLREAWDRLRTEIATRIPNHLKSTQFYEAMNDVEGGVRAAEKASPMPSEAEVSIPGVVLNEHDGHVEVRFTALGSEQYRFWFDNHQVHRAARGPSAACCPEGERYERETQANAGDHPGECSTQRFFIDHGVIHDRVTGKHVRTSDNGQEDGVVECCALLNKLAYEASDSLALLARGVELFGAAPSSSAAILDMFPIRAGECPQHGRFGPVCVGCVEARVRRETVEACARLFSPLATRYDGDPMSRDLAILALQERERKMRSLLTEAEAYLLVIGVQADSYEADLARRIGAALAPSDARPSGKDR